MTARPTHAGRLDSLQILRFLAAFLVLCGHAQHAVVEKMTGSPGLFGVVPLDWGLGVDVFFIISGFVMYYMMHGRFGRPGMAIDFVRRRIIRVVPLYWVFTTIILIAGMATGEIVVPRSNIAFSYLFLPGPTCDEYCFPVFTLGWTLNYEMLFYAIFAIALTQPRRIGLPLVVGVIVGMIAIGHFIPASWPMLHFWTYPLIGEFLMGIGIARAYIEGWRLPRPVGWAMIATGFALAVLSYQTDAYDVIWRLWTGGVPAALILGGAVLALEPRREGRWIALLIVGGDASYALYLSHPIAIRVSDMIGVRLNLLAISPVLPWLLSVAGALIGALIVHYWIEKPMLALLSRRWSRFGSTGYGDGQPAPGVAGTIAVPDRGTP